MSTNLKAADLQETLHLEVLTDHLPFLVAYVDDQHQFHFNNQACVEWFGLARENLKGKHLKELLGEDTYQELKPHLTEALLQERKLQLEASIPHVDGVPRVARVSLIPNQAERAKPQGLFVVVDDITRWKNMENELHSYRDRMRQIFEGAALEISDVNGRHISEKESPLPSSKIPVKSEDVLIHIFNNIPSVVFIQDMKGRFLFVNRRFETVFQVRYGDVFHKTAQEVLPNGLGSNMEAMIRDACRQQEPLEKEVTLNTPQGKREYIVDVMLLRDIDCKPFSVFGISTDVTHSKETEANWRESVRELEQRVRERTHELERKNIALNELLSHIDDERQKSAKAIIANIESMVLPVIQKLEKRVKESDRCHLTMLKENLNSLSSNFGPALSAQHLRLTTREIEICNMIKNGFPNKEIAEEMSLALKTVETHRTNIRKKLGLQNAKINLSTFLKSL